MGRIYNTAIFIPDNGIICQEDKFKKITGAIYNKNGELIEDSLRKSKYAATKHVAKKYINLEKIKSKAYIEKDSIYAGHLHRHFGHFLIETLPEVYKAKLTGKKIVLQRFRNNLPISNHLKMKFLVDLLSLIDVDLADCILINEPTIFESIEINERITEINNSIKDEAKLCFVSIADKVNSEEHVKRIFFSRSNYKFRPSPTSLDKYMQDKGYLVVHPESLNVIDQIRIVKNAKVIAGEAGSALHLSVFCKNCEVKVFGKPFHKNIEMINSLMGHHTTYIDI